METELKAKLRELFQDKDFIAYWNNEFIFDESGERIIDVGLAKFELTDEELRALPTEVFGIACQYRFPGEIEFLGLARTDKHDPLIGGISFGAIDITAGTLGGVVWDKETGEPYLLTNEHVVSNGRNNDPDHPPIGHPIVQPGPIDGGDLDDVAGVLKAVGGLKEDAQAGRTANCDAAIIVPHRDFDPLKYWGSDEIQEQEFIDTKVGDRVVKIGRTSGLSGTDIHALDVTIRLGGLVWSDFLLVQGCIETTTGFLNPGDSGSRVWDLYTKEPIGLGFAGSSFSSFIIPARTIAEKFNVTFTRNGEPDDEIPLPEPEETLWDFLLKLIQKMLDIIRQLIESMKDKLNEL